MTLLTHVLTLIKTFNGLHPIIFHLIELNANSLFIDHLWVGENVHSKLVLLYLLGFMVHGELVDFALGAH